jgi:putative endonuclease
LTSPRRLIGDHAETIALSYLERAGLTLIDRNLGSALGEIDLLMRDGSQWVFVEVRSRSSNAFGGAAASVTKAKQNKLRRQSQVILKAHFGDGQWPSCRFDVCAIDSGEVNWIQGAF